VSVSTLDAELSARFADRRFWLKIDVQGAEGDVLAGGAETLSRAGIVQCELSTRQLYEGQSHYLDVLRVLHEAGFTPVRLIDGFTDPRQGDLLQFDVIAARLGGGNQQL